MMPKPITDLLPTLPLALAQALGIALLLPLSAAEAQAPASAAVPPEAASLTVTTDPVRREALRDTISGTGLVAAWQETTVSATASGLALVDIRVSEGDRVEAGAVVARLDDALLKAEIAQQQAAIESAEASYATAISSNERGRKLTRTGSLSAETAEERETTVKTAEAALAQARATLKTLEVQLDRTIVRAPFAGVVSAKPATLGIIVQTGTEIVKIQRDGALRAAIDVPEQYLARLSQGDAAEVSGPSGEAIAGEIAMIAETVDSATHLGRVEVALPPGAMLKAGMFVRATISAGGGEALTVAEAALTWRDGRTAVFVLAGDGSVSLRPVETGIRRDGRVAVTGDLDDGARVVTSGAGFLNEGNVVRVVSEQAAGSGASVASAR